MALRSEERATALSTATPWNQVRHSVLSRFLVLPLSGVAGLLTARVIVSSVGVPGYGVAALVATLPGLLPSADLGVGAAVTTAVAAGRSSDELHRVLVSSVRVLLALAAGLVILALTLASTSTWGLLTGLPDTAANNWAVGLSVALFGLSLPLAIGSRILLGSGRNFISVLLQGLAAPVVLLICVIGHVAGAGIWLYAGAPACGLFVIGLAGCRQAQKHCGVDVVDVFRRALTRSFAGERIRHIAGPMAVISACLPLAYQSDRLILSHVSSVTQLAIYSAGAAIFAPMLSLVSTGGQSLWPIFVRARLKSAAGEVRRSFIVAIVGLTAFGITLALVLAAIGPRVGTWMLRSGAAVPLSLMASFALLLVVLAAHYPSGMLLTDPAGLRFQAKTSVAMLGMNLVLSIVLTQRLGAPGPALGSAISVAVCLWLPSLAVAVRRVGQSRAELVQV
jgi:O-antigen/teichoic acid export membrane protein